MSIGQFLERQWNRYGMSHQNKMNLLFHIIAVPLFMFATVLGLYAVVALSFFAVVVSASCFTISLVMQARGHRVEPVQPEPFKNGFDAVRRLFTEQWVTFPRFVATGGWFKGMSKPDRKTEQSGAS